MSTPNFQWPPQIGDLVQVVATGAHAAIVGGSAAHHLAHVERAADAVFVELYRRLGAVITMAATGAVF